MKRKKRKLLFFVFLTAILLICIGIVRLTLSPMITELAKARVAKRASYIINEAIEDQMKNGDIDYHNIILLEKDIYGSVTALKTNISEVNRLKTQILSVADTMLLDLDVNQIGVPLGNLIFPELLSGMGPVLPVKILSISSSDAEFHNEFREAGINQTLQQIMMTVKINMTILTPVGTETVEASSGVVIAETVIVGNVPESYTNFNNNRKEDIYGTKTGN